MIKSEGRQTAFCSKVIEKTFAGCTAGGRPVTYITERAVFRLQDGKGLELVEIAPGVDVERDVLAHMPFRPLMAAKIGTMDARCFTPWSY